MEKEMKSDLSIDNFDAIMQIYDKDVKKDALIYFQPARPFYSFFTSDDLEEILFELDEIPCFIIS